MTDSKASREALEIALDLASEEFADKLQLYISYPPDGLGRHVVRARENVEKIKTALDALDAAEQAEPVAWVRRHPDGTLTREYLSNIAIEDVRKRSGAWVPLYAVPVADQQSEEARELVIDWIEDAVEYVNRQIMSPSLEREGRALLARLKGTTR
jgi:hypothetical protein